MKSLELLLKTIFLGLSVSLFFVACSYDNTSIEVGSLFSPSWDFSKSSDFNFDQNYVEIKDGRAQLKALDLKIDSDDFGSGNHNGTKSLDGISLLLSTDPSLDVKNILSSEVSSLVGYWQLNNNYLDSSGRNHHGTGFGDIVTSSGRIDEGVYLDGTGDYISVPDSDDFNLSDFTTTLWVHRHADAYSRLITQQGVGGYWILGVRGTPNRDLFIHLSKNFGGVSQKTNVTLPDDQWSHVGFVHDATNKQVKVFLNGSLIYQDVITDPSAYAISNNLFLGSYNGISQEFIGNLDEVALFNKALSDQNIDDIYQSQKRVMANQIELSPDWTPKWENIKGYWKMDGNWQDSSGNGNHGTAVNGAIHSTSDKKIGVASLKVEEAVSHDYVEVSNSSSLENIQESSFTIQAWYKPLALPRDLNVSTRSHAIVAKSGWHCGIDYYRDGTFRFNLPNTTPAHQRITSTKSYDPNIYYHLVGVYDSVAGETQFFVNGELVGTIAITNVYEFGTVDFTFGTGSKTLIPTGSTWAANGLIDEVAIWDKNLSAADVALIYHRQKQRFAAHYDSEVIDQGRLTASWPYLGWSTELPYGKELVGDIDNDGDADSESASDYSLLTNSFGNGLVGYWNFNESSWAGAAGEVKDLSGQSQDGVRFGNATTTGEGILHRAGEFDGLGDYVSADTNYPMATIQNETLSVWFLKRDDANATNTTVVARMGDTGGIGNPQISIGSGGSAFTNIACIGFFDAGTKVETATTTIETGEWVHFTCATTYSGPNLTISMYKNGTFVDSVTAAVNTYQFAGTKWFFGAQKIGFSRYFNGLIDEVAAWSRVLSPTEIQQLYQRGANRVKFQVKSCVEPSCQCKSFNVSPAGNAGDCDGDSVPNISDFDDSHKAEFIGPGGDGTTYYSELFNRPSLDFNFNCGLNTSDGDSNICWSDEITLKNNVTTTGPAADFSHFPLAAKPRNNSFFQYRTYLEAEDNGACSGNACLPSLASVSLSRSGVDKYYGSRQEVSSVKGLAYQSIQSVSIDADTCVTFQLSPNGTDYYYFNSGAWQVASGESHRSEKLILTNNIFKFSEQFGPGGIYVKAFLETNGLQSSNCQIREVDFVYTTK